MCELKFLFGNKYEILNFNTTLKAEKRLKMVFLCQKYFSKLISRVHLVVVKEKIGYLTDVPHLHGFCTFSVPHLKLK